MQRLIVLALSLILALTGCSRGERKAAGVRPPVILISIDTLRADHLPAYGYRAVETPAIDSLRRESILFRNAWSHCPMTLPSHVSILTGLLPPQHQVRNNLGYVFDGTKHLSLPKLLERSGYATGAAVSAYVLRGATGLGTEFGSYDDAISARADVSVGELQRSGETTVGIAEQWIAAHEGQPFFYFVHLFEPHVPYAAPEPYGSRYASSPYDGEIAAADAIVGRFLESLKKRGIYDRAMIVLLSDHGEGLGDHGENEHGVFLYREAIHVPLIIKLPEAERGGSTVEENVQLIDVYPTIAAVIGADIPQEVHGQSLLRALPRDRAVYSETLLPRLHFGWSDLASLVSGSDHYIRAPRPELYDFRSDPAEKVNVLAANRRRYNAMKQELERYTVDAAAPAAVSREEAEKLAALGYIGSVREETGELPDPKDHIHDVEQIRAAAKLEMEGRTAAALAAYRAVLRSNPRFTDAWIRLAGVCEKSGRVEEAEEAYKRAIATSPVMAAGLALSLGNLQLRMGKLDDATAHAQLALTKPTASSGAHLLLARVALARGDAAGVEREARIASADAGRRREAATVVAQMYVKQGRLGEALRLLDQVRAESPEPVLDLESTRGDALARMNRPAEAEEAFRAELSAFPNNRDAYTRLAVLYVTMGRAEAAEETLERMFAVNPSPSTANLAAGTWAAVENAAAAARWRRRANSLR